MKSVKVIFDFNSFYVFVSECSRQSCRFRLRSSHEDESDRFNVDSPERRQNVDDAQRTDKNNKLFADQKTGAFLIKFSI